MENGSASATAVSGSGGSSTAIQASHGRPRSCAVCAKRKVSCDKNHPCGRCQRAGIRCELPAVEQRPRWARRLVQSSSGNAGPPTHPSASTTVADGVLDRMKQLEALVQDLRGELEQARTSSTGTTVSSTGTSSGGVAAASNRQGSIPRQSGDLSSSFWTGMDRQMADLKDQAPHNEHDADEIEVEGARQQATPACDGRIHRDPLGSSRFLLGRFPTNAHHDTSSLLPLASQIPFLLEVFSERVHSVIAIPHMPSLKKLLHHSRFRSRGIHSHDEEALIFAVFYVAICSLDDDEVAASFNATKDELATSYRKGFETASCKADLLSNPSHNLVQALLIFLTLARLHESPKYLWLMTGLVIRMARFFRYHEDGFNSDKVSAFQTEMQRRVWWNLCALDLRATEDQGTELAIPSKSFSTNLPLNVEDSDIWPEMERTATERSGLTSLSLLRLCSKVTRTTQRMIAAGSSASLEDHVHLLGDLTAELDRDYFSIANQSQHQPYTAAAGTMRVFLGRLTLLAFLPALLASSTGDFSMEIRNKMLVAAIEIAELNHALNTDASCLPWRWVYQTQQHWHAVVFILIEICRRPWSATVERAWAALQSPWLLPARAPSYRNPSIWVPLKRLMAKARHQREQEISRLRHEPLAAEEIFREDRERMPQPSSSVTFPSYYSEEMFYQRWQKLVDPGMAAGTRADATSASHAHEPYSAANHSGYGLASSNGSSEMHTVASQPSPSTFATRAAANIDATNSVPNEPPTGVGVGSATSFGNLDTFLGPDTDMGFLDGVTDEDFLNFDWNSWFESANGTL